MLVKDNHALPPAIMGESAPALSIENRCKLAGIAQGFDELVRALAVNVEAHFIVNCDALGMGEIEAVIAGGVHIDGDL
ncbi:MAG: hypothetical protein AAFQ84_00650, partial [Pseudomonadota bacterium]